MAGPVRIERRLSAILAADVAGYSRLMHRDEEDTHARLTALLTEAIHPAIAERGGRIVKNTGDGFLAEFPSAVEAVRAALQFQICINELTSGEAEDKRIAFRIGINIGDVIVEPHDIFGDGVNIAARLESIAEPDGICISSSVYDQVQGKVGVQFGDLGEHNFKNIARPVHVYAVGVRGPAHAVTSFGNARSSSSAHRLSMIVLPFANLSGDPAQDYFVDGVTESLTTDLSRISGSFVIGRHTAFTYKDKAVDLKRVGRELGVNYVIEGSVQRSGNRLRVNVRLVDAEIGTHLWTDRFDKPVADLLEMQDEVTARIANALDAQLVQAEAQRAERSRHPDALDLCFQGRYFLNQGLTTKYLSHARSSFERALALDPENIEALVGIAMIETTTVTNFMLDDRGTRLAQAEANLIKVLSMAPHHARAHGVLAALQAFTNRGAQAIGEFERALELDRNLADAHALLGFSKVFSGRGAESEAHIRHALRLSPRDINAFRWMHLLGVVKMILGADTEAVEWLRRSLEANRNFPIAHFQFAAALALAGSLDEARAAARAGFAFDPDFTIRRTKGLALSNDPTFRAGSKRIRDGMLMAGIPEE